MKAYSSLGGSSFIASLSLIPPFTLYCEMLALMELADDVVEVDIGNFVLEANMIIHFCKEQSAEVRGLFRSGFTPMLGVRPNTTDFIDLREQQLANRTEPSVSLAVQENFLPGVPSEQLNHPLNVYLPEIAILLCTAKGREYTLPALKSWSLVTTRRLGTYQTTFSAPNARERRSAL